MNNTARRIMEMRRSNNRMNDYSGGYDRYGDSRGYDRRDMRGRDYNDENDYARGSYSKNAYSRGYNAGRDYDDGNDYYEGNNSRYMKNRSDPTYTRQQMRPDYNSDYNNDGYDRRTQPFKINGEMDYNSNDYGSNSEMKLSKKDIQEWKRNLRNADGTSGEHFEMEHLVRAAENMGVKFRDYSEKEYCIVANMLYSDMCEAVKGIVPPEKELHLFARMAKAWLEDEDAPDPKEKLALYYYCIVKED